MSVYARPSSRLHEGPDKGSHSEAGTNHLQEGLGDAVEVQEEPPPTDPGGRLPQCDEHREPYQVSKQWVDQ